MTDEEMDETNRTRALDVRNPLYSKHIDSGDKISLIVSNLGKDLSSVGEKISLKNTELVRDTVLRYLRSCERTGALPTKVGVSRSCGISSKAMDKFIREHPDHPTSAFLELVWDAFSEALSQASLNGSVQPIVAIFLQKALYDLRENEPVAQKRDNPLGEFTDTESIERKYGEIVTD